MGVEYPCWVYSSENPFRIELCESKKDWNMYRRNKWRKANPLRTSAVLTEVISSMDADWGIQSLIDFLAHSQCAISDDVLVGLLAGDDPSLLDPDILEELAYALGVPVVYLYADIEAGAPNIFADREKAVKQQLATPSHTPDGMLASLEYPTHGLRVFHIRYTLPDFGGYKRAHVVTTTAPRATEALIATKPEAQIVEMSSQLLMDGIVLLND